MFCCHPEKGSGGTGFFKPSRSPTGCETQVRSKTETMMLKKFMLTTLVLTGMVALTGVAAAGQDNPEPGPQRAAAPGYHQIDFGGSFYKTFVSSTSGMGLKQTPSDGTGGLIEARHLVSPLVGYELAIGFNSGSQKYEPIAGACGLTCQYDPVTITGKQISISLDYVPSFKTGNLRAFAVGGLGILLSVPDATPLGNNTSIRGAYVYGGGAEYDLTEHLGIRGQVRGIMYKAPNVSAIYPADGQYTQTITPMGGVYFRF